MSKLEKIAKLYRDADGDIVITGELEEALVNGVKDVIRFRETLEGYIERDEKVPAIMVWRALNAIDVLNGTKDF